MAGADQIGAPEGPHICVPVLFFVVGRASAMVYVFQTCAPVVALSATRLPRKRQHSYVDEAPAVSSPDATGTYRRPRSNAGVPVTRASGNSSAFTFHSSLPVPASTAYTFAARSPMNAA